LSVFPIELPPLSERGSDIETLVKHFLGKLDSTLGINHLSSEAAQMLRQHSWPGNVRELQHVVERASILAEGGAILPEHLGLSGRGRTQTTGQAA
jgi:transcriptional regulator with GAF, ATPase, and Fis domain